MLTAGVGQRPGETRLELLTRNEAVFAEVVPAVLDAAPEAVLVVATNPVDVMTHVAARVAAGRGVPGSRVLGSGTTLDTARFRALLGRRLGVDAAHVHAYVVGEHDQRSVLTVCSPMAEVAGVADVTVSLPQIVGGAGVLEALPLALPEDEELALARSAAVVREAIDGLGSGRS